MKKRVTILCGGTSSERSISLQSGKAVAEAAKKAGFLVEFVDITSSQQLNGLEIDGIVLPIFHGAYGEDGQAQRQLERKNVYFLGSGSVASKNCFDKSVTREIFAANNLPVSPGVNVYSFEEYLNNPISKKPHVLKVAKGGSSIGTLIVRDPTRIDEVSARSVFSVEPPAVLEKLVEGVEVTVPVLGNTALPVIEIIPPEGQEFNFENKYNGASSEICPAVSISQQIEQQAQRLAEKAHKVMDCRHLSRVDMIISTTGDITLLEINTIPGMTGNSLYPIGAKAAGYSMPGLVKEFVKMAEKG